MLWRPHIKQHQGACIVREQDVKGYGHTIPADSFSCRPKKLQVTGKDILFGIIECEDEIFGNHILLLEKQYPYSWRQNKNSPSIRVLTSKIKHCFLIETMIAKSDNKLETHDMKCSKYKLSRIRSFHRFLHLLIFHVNREECTGVCFYQYVTVCVRCVYGQFSFRSFLFLYFSFVFIQMQGSVCKTL